MSVSTMQKPHDLIEKAQRLEARFTVLQEKLNETQAEFKRLSADAKAKFGIASLKELKAYRDNIEQQRHAAQQTLFDAVTEATGILDKLDKDLAKIHSRA